MGHKVASDAIIWIVEKYPHRRCRWPLRTGVAPRRVSGEPAL